MYFIRNYFIQLNITFLYQASAASGSPHSAGSFATPSRAIELPPEPVPDTFTYSESTGPIPREALLEYFDVAMRQLLDADATQGVVNEYLSTGAPLSVLLPRLQRHIMAFDCRIEPIYGCRYLGMVPQSQPQDIELQNGIKRFMFICMRAYVNCLQRAAAQRTASGKPLITSSPMSREDCMEFYEACNCTMTMPETKNALRQVFEETKAPPTSRIVEVQKSIFPLLGYDADFGVKCLERSQFDIQSDPPRMRKQAMFLLCAQMAVEEAVMTPEEKKTFYSQIPIHMHNSPYIFVFQQQQMMMQQRGGGHHGHGHGHHGGGGGGAAASVGQVGGMDRSGAAASSNSNSRGSAAASSSHPGHAHAAGMDAMRAFMMSAEGQAKMKALSQRISTCKSRAQSEVTSWSAEKRETFFDECASEESPITQISELSSRNSGAGGPLGQIQAFMELDDSALDTLLKLQAAVEQDSKAGGTLGSKLMRLQERARADLTAASASSDAASAAAARSTPAVAVLSALGSLNFFGSR